MQTESRLCTLKAASPSAPIWAQSPGKPAAGLTSRPGLQAPPPPNLVPASRGAARGGGPACAPSWPPRRVDVPDLGGFTLPHVEACGVQLTPSTCSQGLGSYPPPHPATQRPPRCQWLRLSPCLTPETLGVLRFSRLFPTHSPALLPRLPLSLTPWTEEAPPFKGPYLTVLRLWELSANQQAFN